MKYLFRCWKNIKRALRRKCILLLLDFDGTLAPIAPTPKDAELPAQTKKILRKLSAVSDLKLAVISGRFMEDIKKKVGLANIIYCGNHGLEMEGPSIKFKKSSSHKYRKNLRAVKRKLEGRLNHFRGAFIEDKGLSFSLHYRLLDKIMIPELESFLQETAAPYLSGKEFRIIKGKMVFEISPYVEWDKGKAALLLFSRERILSSHNPVIVVYVGDDSTDEDAFKVLRKRGVTVFVGRPVFSHAEYYLRSTKEVNLLLSRILELKEEENVRAE
jgi:trehalose-phosphatase